MTNKLKCAASAAVNSSDEVLLNENGVDDTLKSPLKDLNGDSAAADCDSDEEVLFRHPNRKNRVSRIVNDDDDDEEECTKGEYSSSLFGKSEECSGSLFGNSSVSDKEESSKDKLDCDVKKNINEGSRTELDLELSVDNKLELKTDATDKLAETEAISGTDIQRKPILLKNDDLFDAEDEDDEPLKLNCDEISQKKTTALLQNSDLFDAEDSDCEKEDVSVKKQIDSEIEEQSNEKSTSKKNKKTVRSVRKEKDDKLQIHSETQRLVRESRVRLPYHRPQQKTLFDFLNRKKNVPSSIKPSPKELNTLVKTKKNTSENFGNENVVKNLEDSNSLPPFSLLRTTEESEIEKTEISNNSDQANSSQATENLQPNESQTNVAEKVDKNSSVDCSVSHNSQTEENMLSLTDISYLDSGFESQQATQNIKKCEPLNVSNEAEFSQTATSTPNISESSCSRLITDFCLSEKVKAVKPQLSHFEGSFIDLDFSDKEDSDVQKCEQSEVQNLMDRFIKHATAKPLLQPKKKMNLTIIKKEIKDGEEQLVKDNVTVNIGDETVEDSRPGAKLLYLKETLQAKIAARREKERQKRMQMHELDNEEGFEGKLNEEEEVEEEEEEEEELTDTDVEETEEEEEDSEEEIVSSKKKKPKNAFIDDEAEDDDDDEDIDDDENSVNGDLFQESEEKENLSLILEMDSNEDVPVESKKAKRKLSLERVGTQELFDNIETNEDAIPKSLGSFNNSVDSIDLIGTEIPAHQPGGGFTHKRQEPSASDHEMEFLSPLTGWKSTQAKLNASKNLISSKISPEFEKKSSSEDSLLLHSSDESLFSFNDKKALTKTDDVNSQDNYDELLGLCSGKFEETQKPKPTNNLEKLFSLSQNHPSQNSQDNMDELLDLCSGHFAGSVRETSSVITKDKGLTEDEDTLSTFKMLSDPEDDNEDERQGDLNEGDKQEELTEDEYEELDDLDADNYNSDEEAIDRKFTTAKGMDFFDKEAELSGSEAESDEDLDIAEEDDILEEEEGDKDDVLSDEELRNQVGRVHLKTLLDEDQRKLRLYKEMYLQDGELHSEGAGRQRKFRWKNTDYSEDEHMKQESEDEQEENEWIIQRNEREEWLQSHKNGEADEMALKEESPEIKLRKFSLRTSSSTRISENRIETSKKPQKEAPSPRNPLKLLTSRGSFLARGKEHLEKLAQITRSSSDSNPNGPKHSGNFVFAAVSPDTQTKPKPQLRRTSSSPANILPVAKKPKLERTRSHIRGSVFNYF